VESQNVSEPGLRRDEPHAAAVGNADLKEDQQPSKGTMNKAIVLLTVVLAATAIITNFQTCNALRDSRQAFQTSQHPYVNLGRKDGTIAEFAYDSNHPTEPVGLKVYLQNGGQSAALNPKVLIYMSVILNGAGVKSETNPYRGQPEVFEYIYRYKTKNGSGGTSSTDSIPPQAEDVHYVPNLFSRDQYQSFRDGQRAVILSGLLQYCDVFGNYTCGMFDLFWNGPPMSAFAEVNQSDCTLLYGYPKRPPPDNGEYLLPCEQPAEREEREKTERAELLKRAASASSPTPSASPSPN
jgi:hypothetical protein